jgi:hypothetical protein
MTQQIQIPNPCSQNPRNFTPTGKGGFCQSCQKEVVDFRKMSENEVIDFFKSISKKRCGIFYPHQLKSEEVPFRKVKFPILWAIGFWGITGFSFPALGQSSGQPKSEQTTIDKKEDLKSSSSFLPKRTIKGRVIDFYFNETQPLSGALVAIKGLAIGTTADQDGYFELEVPDFVTSQKIILVLSFIGYKINEVTVYDTQLPVQLGEIQLQEDNNFVMGEFIYLKPNLWQRFKGVFKSNKSQNCSNPKHQHA